MEFIKQKRNVLLVGSGNLGSRYLQGLLSMNINLKIFIVEPSEKSIDNTKNLLSKNPFGSKKNYVFFKSFPNINEKFDIAIIATTANCRYEILCEIKKRYIVEKFILEKVLAQSISQLKMIEELLRPDKKKWVNTPRRSMKWHNKIKSNFFAKIEKPLNVTIVGGDWGLVCNAIHFIDLVAWWKNLKLKKVNSDGLINWFESKRPGFYDAYGVIEAYYNDGSYLKMVSEEKKRSPKIKVKTDKDVFEILETAGFATSSTGLKITGENELQSRLTSRIIEDLFNNKDPGLVSLNESTEHHLLLIDSLLKSWNKLRCNSDDILPIT